MKMKLRTRVLAQIKAVIKHVDKIDLRCQLLECMFRYEAGLFKKIVIFYLRLMIIIISEYLKKSL